MKLLLGLLLVLCLYGCGDIESPHSTNVYVETVDENGELLTKKSSSSSFRVKSSSSSVLSSSSFSSSSSSRYSSSRYSSSRYSSSYYRSSSSYSSSSSAWFEYLSKDMQMELTLTYYHQLKSYEGTSSKTDGDPIIYFSVVATDYEGDTLASVKTSKIFNSRSDKTNISVWSGDSSVFLTLPRDTYAVSVCPIVYDYDPLSDDKMSSGYCYIQYQVGLLESREKVYQEDEKASYYELEWSWNLY